MFTPRSLTLDDLAGLSARNRRILAFGIRGGDGDDGLDLDALLERVAGIADLSDDDLAALDADLIAAAELYVEAARQARDDDALANAIRAEEAHNTVCGEAATRFEHAEEIARQADEIASRLRPEASADGEGDGEPGEGEGDGDGETGEGEGEAGEGEAGGDGEGAPGEGDGEAAGGEGETPERIAAAAGRTPVATRVAARRPAAMRPRVQPAEQKFKLIASANAPGVVAGSPLDTPQKILDTFDNALRATGGSYHGAPQRIPLFSIGSMDPADIYGAERTLGRDAEANEAKIGAVTSAKALKASGGICAPAPQRYDLPVIGTDDRPVKGALASFGVPRGGIRLLPPPVLTDVADAVSVWTELNDRDPGGDGDVTKGFATLDCPAEVETLVDAIVKQLRIGNYRNLFFPEQVEAWVKLAAVAQARLAEQKLLTKIGDLSTHVAVSQVLGTTRTVLAAMDRAGATLRNYHRISPETPLRLLAPAWLLDNMITDLSREIPGATAERLATSDAQIQGWLAARQINVSWYLDSEDGANMQYGLQGAGELLGWKSNAVCYLYLEGSWLFLDGGRLDFGIVRDSVLNGTNDFMIFSEDFENAAFHGTPGTSYRLDIDICPSGETASTADTSGLCVAGS